MPKSIPIAKALQAFQRSLEKQNKNAGTVKSYVNDVRQFHVWAGSSLGADYGIDQITKSDIQDFRSFLLTRNSPPASVNRRLTALRQFYEFCKAEYQFEQNPVAEVSGIQTQAVPPIVLTRREALLLLRTAEQTKRPMEASIILLLLHAGMRSREICDLTIGDLHLTAREARLFIRGQGGKKMRFVHLTARTQTAMRQYCKRKGIRILARKRRQEPLFTQVNGNPMTQQVIDHVVKRAGKLCGLPYVTPTMLRNTCAVHLLQQGESATEVARTLGMLTVKNLQAYVQQAEGEAGPRPPSPK